jgi:hypothetical protein
MIDALDLRFWIGFNGIESLPPGGAFVANSDGAPKMYGNWYVNGKGAAATDCTRCTSTTRCVYFFYGSKNWVDEVCDRTMPFMCEKVDHEISATGHIIWNGIEYHIHNADSK